MLAGKTVLDLTWVLGGPFAGQLLAQLGAEVIKIEPTSGDQARTMPPFTESGESAFFLSVNRGKRSVAIDLKSKEGLAAFYGLVRTADAVIYGYAPDVPARLGIDFESLKTVNPRIVVAQIVGLHDEGEYAAAPAFDLVLQAMAGVMSITGDECGQPTRVGYQVADLAGGLYLALATVSAMLKADLSGNGDRIQVSLFDAQLAMLTWQAQNYLSFGTLPKALGARHATIAPSDAYPTSDGRYIAVAPTGQAFWRKFCAAIGREDLVDDPRFVEPTARIQHVDKLTAELSSTMLTKTADDWEALFAEARVPASVVRRVDEALAHPIVTARKMIEMVSSREGSNAAQLLGNPFKYRDAQPLGYPPSLGEDTSSVLAERVGCTEADLARMEASGSIRGSNKVI